MAPRGALTWVMATPYHSPMTEPAPANTLQSAARADEDLLFDAVLHPNRSLNRGGFLILMALFGGFCAVTGMMFLIAGAWPVAGFLGLDVLLLYIAFRLNYRDGRLVETLRLTPSNLLVRRVTPGGAVQSWNFQPYWLQVELERPTAHDSRLMLGSHGRRLTVGTFLTSAERVELAAALRDALRRCRCVPATSH